MLKPMLLALCAVISLAPARTLTAQVAGEATIGVTIEEMKLVVLGWSARQKLLGKPVFNEKNERIGEVEDVIVSPKRTVSWAILGVGGFLGIAEKKVAIPMDQLKLTNNRLILAGATKDALKAMPAFQYAKS